LREGGGVAEGVGVAEEEVVGVVEEESVKVMIFGGKMDFCSAFCVSFCTLVPVQPVVK
jgi:hypothetical protein